MIDEKFERDKQEYIEVFLSFGKILVIIAFGYLLSNFRDTMYDSILPILITGMVIAAVVYHVVKILINIVAMLFPAFKSSKERIGEQITCLLF